MIIRTINGTLIVLGIIAIVLGIVGSSLLMAKLGIAFIGLAVFIAFFAEGRKAKKAQASGSKGSKEGEDITLKDYLRSRVIGQDRAIEDVVSVIKMKVRKQEVSENSSRLLGTFLFVGSTGVGKTELSKAIAEWFNYKYGHQFLSFDMGGFSSHYTASSLVGSPKGYIGSEEGGALTRPLMQNPKAVILFDEIEKAYHTLYKPLMRLVDEGLIQEISTGAYARVSQGIIIFTSNLFQGTIREISRSSLDDIQKELLIRDVLTGRFNKVSEIVPQQVLQQDIDNAGGKPFPPEFIGRIDKVVVFKPLNDLDLTEITARIMARYGMQVDMKQAYQLTQKYRKIAKEYGVRVFIKKIEEELLK